MSSFISFIKKINKIYNIMLLKFIGIEFKNILYFLKKKLLY